LQGACFNQRLVQLLSIPQVAKPDFYPRASATFVDNDDRARVSQQPLHLSSVRYKRGNAVDQPLGSVSVEIASKEIAPRGGINVVYTISRAVSLAGSLVVVVP
jgi:hypothetical protein